MQIYELITLIRKKYITFIENFNYSPFMKFETKAIWVGQAADQATGATIVPIYQTSTFTQEEINKHKGYEYSRVDNPTTVSP